METERDTSKSWWSNHHNPTSNHLLELQKEIKEEEEEIFADINSLINSRPYLYSTLDDCEDDVVGEEIACHKSTIETNPIQKTSFTVASTTTPATAITDTTITTATTINNNNITRIRNYLDRLDEQLFYSDDADEEEDLLPDRYKSRIANKTTVTSTRRDFHSNSNVNDDEDEDTSRDMDHFHIDSGPPPEEVDFMHQDPYLNENIIEHHHDLRKCEIDEDQNYSGSHKFSVDDQISQQNYQAFQAVIQHVTSNLPKPCVFFLEGNCRRSDCKYSHDLSNITCKYWIEGFCFKGEMCPFSHSYNPPSDPNCLDEEGLKLLGKKELHPTFAIESEADFPSLPLDAPTNALNDSTKSSNNTDSLTSTIKDQILSSNPAVVFKTVKKKRKKG